MENALVAIISTVLIILSSVIMMMSTLQSTSKMAASWQVMNTEFNNTRTTAISVEADDYYGGAINLTVSNNGQSNLYDFSEWDVIAQFEDGGATYLGFADGTVAGTGQWTVTGIELGPGQPEIFDPGILNPNEHLKLQLNIAPELGPGQSARITVSTPSGVKAQATVTRSLPV